jgi:hypothetical protein
MRKINKKKVARKKKNMDLGMIIMKPRRPTDPHRED